jgi:hypothetical protein
MSLDEVLKINIFDVYTPLFSTVTATGPPNLVSTPV